VRIANKGVCFKLGEDTSELNENEKFNIVAKKGDIVIKPAYSDTLRLIKTDKVFLYTFQKFNL
jgi:hypothetical protein